MVRIDCHVAVQRIWGRLVEDIAWAALRGVLVTRYQKQRRLQSRCIDRHDRGGAFAKETQIDFGSGRHCGCSAAVYVCKIRPALTMSGCDQFLRPFDTACDHGPAREQFSKMRGCERNHTFEVVMTRSIGQCSVCAETLAR